MFDILHYALRKSLPCLSSMGDFDFCAGDIFKRRFLNSEVYFSNFVIAICLCFCTFKQVRIIALSLFYLCVYLFMYM